MSDQFARNNEENSIELFYKKFNYAFTVDGNAGTLDNVKDFLHAEKFLYGRVNRNYVPIVPSRNVVFEDLNPGSMGSSARTHPFVARAFRDMSTQIRKASISGQLNVTQDTSFLASLLPTTAYKNPNQLYMEHLDSVISGIGVAYRKDNVKFKDFDEFMTAFLPTLENLTTRLPYTLPAFVKHRLCPIMTTGLVIEIASADAAKDVDKINNFINDANWPFYVNMCRSYGFSIDKNAPWRLIADIGSSEMIEYANNYGYSNTDAILNSAFEPAHILYYERFISFMERAYDSLRLDNYIEVDVCRYSELKPRIVVPKKYGRGELLKKYGEEYFLNLYLKIRMMEMEKRLPIQKQKRLVRNTVRVYLSGQQSNALRAFERIIGQTYSSSGSLTKHAQGAKLRKEQAFVEDELGDAVSTYR